MPVLFRVLAAAVLSAAVAFHSSAQPPPASPGDQEFAVQIQHLTRSANWTAALQLLDSRPELAARADVIRLRASLLHQLGRRSEALVLLERLLATDPKDALSRFQLGETHFADRRDRAAELAFRLALVGMPDPRRRQVAKSRLAEIHARREWRFWAGAAVAPDSNISSATDASRIELFGLPFELDDAARQQGGVTFSAFGGIERRFAYAKGQAVRANLIGSASDAAGIQFDTASLALRLGPDFQFADQAEVSVQATTSWRWFGGELLEARQGLFGSAEFGERTRWSGAVFSDAVDDRLNEGRDGWMAGIDVARTHYLTPSSVWRLSLSLTHREADAEPEGYDQQRVSLGFLEPLPFAVAVYVEPYLQRRRHSAASFAFGDVREDVEAGIGARFSKRDWIIADAYPYLSISISHSESTIELGDFSRERIEFGLTREF